MVRYLDNAKGPAVPRGSSSCENVMVIPKRFASTDNCIEIKHQFLSTSNQNGHKIQFCKIAYFPTIKATVWCTLKTVR